MFCHSIGRDVVLSTVGNGLCNVERLPNSSAVKALFPTFKNHLKETAAGKKWESFSVG
jgi:hypothetical protein